MNAAIIMAINRTSEREQAPRQVFSPLSLYRTLREDVEDVIKAKTPRSPLLTSCYSEDGAVAY